MQFVSIEYWIILQKDYFYTYNSDCYIMFEKSSFFKCEKKIEKWQCDFKFAFGDQRAHV